MLTESKGVLFVSNENRLRELSRQLGLEAKSADARSIYWDFLSKIMWVMELNANDFDENCPICISAFSEQFDNYLDWLLKTRGNEREQREVEQVLILSYRFLSEYKINYMGKFNSEFDILDGFIQSNLKNFSDSLRTNLLHVDCTFPARIAQHYLREFKSLKLGEVVQVRDDFLKIKHDWTGFLRKEKEKVDALQAVIQRQTSESNFLALNQGFSDMKNQKKTELCWAKFGFFLLGFCLLIIPLIQFFNGFQYFLSAPSVADEASKQSGVDIFSVWLSLVPLLTCELILLYFFRIVLGQYRSVKAQLVQLDLRISLCRFIEAYTEHMAKIKKDAPDVLQKFEALIFSGLMTEGERIPSVLDGSEQLAQLLRSIQSKG